MDWIDAARVTFETNQREVVVGDRRRMGRNAVLSLENGQRPRGVALTPDQVLVADLEAFGGRVRGTSVAAGPDRLEEIDAERSGNLRSGPPAVTIADVPQIVYVGGDGTLRTYFQRDGENVRFVDSAALGDGWRLSELTVRTGADAMHVIGASDEDAVRHTVVRVVEGRLRLDTADHPLEGFDNARCAGDSPSAQGRVTADGDGSRFLYACIAENARGLFVASGTWNGDALTLAPWVQVAGLEGATTVWPVLTPSGPQLLVSAGGAQLAVFFDDSLSETGRIELPAMALIRPSRDPAGVMRLGWYHNERLDWTAEEACTP
jgi:hypothetical protein